MAGRGEAATKIYSPGPHGGGTAPVDRAVAPGDLVGGGFSAGNRGFPADQKLRTGRRNTQTVTRTSRISLTNQLDTPALRHKICARCGRRGWIAAPIAASAPTGVPPRRAVHSPGTASGPCRADAPIGQATNRRGRRLYGHPGRGMDSRLAPDRGEARIRGPVAGHAPIAAANRAGDSSRGCGNDLRPWRLLWRVGPVPARRDLQFIATPRKAWERGVAVFSGERRPAAIAPSLQRLSGGIHAAPRPKIRPHATPWRRKHETNAEIDLRSRSAYYTEFAPWRRPGSKVAKGIGGFRRRGRFWNSYVVKEARCRVRP